MSTMTEAIVWLMAAGFCLSPLLLHEWNGLVQRGADQRLLDQLTLHRADDSLDDSPHDWVMNSLPDDIKKELDHG